MNALDVAAAFTGRIVEGTTAGDSQFCMQCDVEVSGYADRRATLCGPCTYAELGTTAYIAALRTEFGLSQKVVEARLEKYGPPYVAPKEWITPKSRLFR